MMAMHATYVIQYIHTPRREEKRREERDRQASERAGGHDPTKDRWGPLDKTSRRESAELARMLIMEGLRWPI
jgi:hypothetical protein